MDRLHKSLFLLIFIAPLLAQAEMQPDDLPPGTKWYLHADLKQMRESAAGSEVYKLMDAKVFMEIHNGIGIDINKEADRLTAFSSLDNGTIIVLEGKISKDSQDKVLALAAVEAKLDIRNHKGKTYYQVLNTKSPGQAKEHGIDSDLAFDGIDDKAYFSFALPNKLIVASSDGALQALLDSGGRVAGSPPRSGSLFVLTADKSFVQAGLKTDDLSDEEGGWKSNIIRNTEQVALLVSESKDHIAVEAQLVSADPRMAESIGGIVNGLISLQAFNTELDPEIRELIQNTRIQVKEKLLSISTVIDPQTIVRAIKD